MEPSKREQLTKIVLILIFLSGFGIAIWALTPERILTTLQSWDFLDLALLGFAAFRLGRLVAYDRVMEPLRAYFAQTVPDATGAGESVEPRGEGVRQALGQMITCPICAGTWIAALLVIGLVWLPGLAQLFVWAAAAIGLAELVGSTVEALCWVAQRARVQAGRPVKEK